MSALAKHSIEKIEVAQNAANDTLSPGELAAQVAGINPREVVENALADANPHAVLEDEVIQALKLIRAKDQGEYQRLRARSKKHKVALDDLTKSESNRGDRDNLVNIVLATAKQHARFAHAEGGQCFAIVEDENRRVTYDLKTPGFETWLRGEIYRGHEIGVPDQIMRTAVATMEAIGINDGERIQAHCRCAGSGQTYYIDLCNDDWQAIKIEPNSVEVEDKPSVFFTRAHNMLALPMPDLKQAKAKDIDLLWSHVKVPVESRLLVIAWLLDALRPDTAYPVIELGGEKGSSKSTTQKRLRALIDPNKVMSRANPKRIEDIHTAAANSHVVSFENLSRLSPDQQDAICILSTGGGYAARKLYSDGNEHVSNSHAPVLMNGINHLATQADLIERTITINLPTIAANDRADDQTLNAAWERDYPHIFAAMLKLMAEALAVLPTVIIQDGMQRRLLDYQRLGEAVAIVLGHKTGEFSRQFGEMIDAGMIRGLDTFGAISALQAFVTQQAGKPRSRSSKGAAEGCVWSGTIGGLKSELDRMPGIDRSNWPQSPRTLGSQIRNNADGLRQLGINVIGLGRGGGGTRYLGIVYAEPAS